MRKMSELKEYIKKRRYDGRSKKRKWEERRSDYKAEASGQVNPAEAEKKLKIEDNFERIKRRKYVLMLGYSGVNYFGMQRYTVLKCILQ